MIRKQSKPEPKEWITSEPQAPGAMLSRDEVAGKHDEDQWCFFPGQ